MMSFFKVRNLLKKRRPHSDTGFQNTPSYVFKHALITVFLNAEEKRVLDQLRSKDKDIVNRSLKSLYGIDPVLLDVKTQGPENVRWLIKMCDKYTAHSMYEIFEILERSEFMHSKIWVKFKATLSNFNQESGEKFLKLFRCIVSQNLKTGQKIIKEAVFHAWLNLPPENFDRMRLLLKLTTLLRKHNRSFLDINTKKLLIETNVTRLRAFYKNTKTLYKAGLISNPGGTARLHCILEPPIILLDSDILSTEKIYTLQKELLFVFSTHGLLNSTNFKRVFFDAFSTNYLFLDTAEYHPLFSQILARGHKKKLTQAWFDRMMREVPTFYENFKNRDPDDLSKETLESYGFENSQAVYRTYTRRRR